MAARGQLGARGRAGGDGAVSRRRWLGSVAAMGGAALAAACGVGGTQAPAKSALKGTMTYRTWWAPTTEAHKTWWDFVKPDFEAKHPGVKLELEFMDFGQVYEKFVTSVAGGTLPDVMHSSIVWARDFWDLSGIEELSPYIAKDRTLAMDKFIPSALFYNQVGGKIYGIPHEGPDATLLFYNATHLAEVGIDGSTKAVDKWTWDDFTNAAVKLTKKASDGTTDRAGYNVPTFNTRQMAGWLPTQGGSFYDKDQKAVAFDNDRGESVVQLQINLRNRVGPPVTGADLFTNGKVSMMSANMFFIGDLKLPRLRPSFNWSVMGFPKGPQGTKSSTAAFVNMDVVPKQGKNKDLAAAWLNYYTGLEMGRHRMRLIGRANPRKDFYDSAEFKAEVASHPQAARIPEMAALGNVLPFLRTDAMGREVEPIMGETGEGKRPPKDGLREAARLANQILSRPAR